ncbi:MAG: hypothetical protein EAZ13_01565 [Sphingobacteriia bacterium]|nr:MAG: hypothetical protein EAZ41_00785 [Sphingobacteriia bacterium]TAG31584.1 MAG: hypothetical protein EAZ35_02720 [Sphingobacteriia bacterium]TAH09021.1 MAG: hypothetical protein EAZ13_01565 [Sphingobacteriia bacterium]
MRAIKQLIFTSLLLIMVVAFSSWGFLVHKTVHQLAIYQLPAEMSTFFYSNMDKLVYDAVRPDIRRNTDSAEAPKHFIDLEPYGEKAAYRMPMGWEDAVTKYSLDTLNTYGYVPYHIIWMKEQLTKAMREKNKDSIIFYAADIGHYIGDANVPLHTSINYDGQLTNQKGLHSLWESMIPELEIENYNLYSKHKVRYLRKPSQAIWKAIRRAHELLPELLAKEIEVSQQFTEAEKFRVQERRGKPYKNYTPAFAKAYAASLKNTINEQLIHSADLIADFWYTCWIDAGKPELGELAGWNDKKQTMYQQELEYYQSNTLIKEGRLQARKNAGAASE